MSNSIRIIIIEDNISDANLIIHTLKQAGYSIFHKRVDQPEELKQVLHEGIWDVILSDYNLPDFSAPEALQILQSTGLDIPFIVVSGIIGEDAAVELMRAGARDYLMKDKLAKIGPVITREISEARTRQKQNRSDFLQRIRAKLLEYSTSHKPDQIRHYLLSLLCELTNSEVSYYLQKDIINSSAWNIDLVETTAQNNPTMYSGAVELHPADWETRISETKFCEMEGRLFNLQIKDRIIHIHREVFLPRKKEEKTYEFIGIANKTTPYLVEDIDSFQNLTNLYSDISEKINSSIKISQQLSQLSSLYEVETAINSRLNLNEVLEILLEQVISLFPIHAANILLWDDSKKVLEYKIGKGFLTDVLQKTRLKLGVGYAGKAAEQHEIVYIPDLLSQDNELAKSMRTKQEEFMSYYGFPLISKGQLKGVMEIFHRDQIRFDDQQISFINILAIQAANAIDKLELVGELQKINQELSQAYVATLEGWSSALDLRDKDSEDHSQRVTEMTIRLAREMGFSEQELISVRKGALLHDIGKLGIPDSILHKPGKLTPEERKTIELHPKYAYQWISPIKFLNDSIDIPYCHHEKWDGTGYPQGLKGEDIPLAARIFAIIDVWDALLSDRPYRAAWPKEKAIEYIKSLSGTQFDPKVVDKFFSLRW